MSGLFLALLFYIEFTKVSTTLGMVAAAVLSVFVILKSAGYTIEALAHYGLETDVSKYFIGFIVISISTSLP